MKDEVWIEPISAEPLEGDATGIPEAIERPGLGTRVWGVVKELAIILLLFLALRNFVVQARYIPSASMHPTLLERDRLLVELVSKHFVDFRRGEILVFYTPGTKPPDFWETILSSFGLYDDGALIKRVIGLPGETIEVRGGEGVYVNGRKLKEPYIAEVSAEDFGPKTIPTGHLFMMGDNRNRSNDSRRWGALPMDHVIGRAAVRFYPFRRIGFLAPGEAAKE